MLDVFKIVSEFREKYTINWLIFAGENVIAMTMTGVSMNSSMLAQLNLQTVICEEAGEVMEAQTICTLFPSVKHAIFIGDPLQLRYDGDVTVKYHSIFSTDFVQTSGK